MQWVRRPRLGRFRLGVRGLGTLALGLSLFGVTGELSAQTVQAGRVTVRPSGLGQFQFNTTSVRADDLLGGTEPAPSTFETRRIRMIFDVTIDDWITGRIQPDFAMGSLRLTDVWVNLGFDERFALRIGQFYKPFSRFATYSSSQMLPIERGARIRGLEAALARGALMAGLPAPWRLEGDAIIGEEYDILSTLGYAGRDLGVAAHGRFGRVGYEVGLFNGQGIDARDVNSAKSWAARVSLRPSATAPLTLGAAVSRRETRAVVDPLPDRSTFDGTAWALDAEWGAFRRPGVRALAEIATGKNFLADRDFLGAQAVVGLYHALGGGRVEGLEPLLRVSYGDPDRRRDDDHGWLLTPGVNLYFFGRNRLMLNWDVYMSGNDEVGTQSALRAQAQLHF